MPEVTEQKYNNISKDILSTKIFNSDMQIRMACVEDGIDNTGFRKISAYIKSIHDNTKIAYIPTGSYRSLLGYMREKDGENISDQDIQKVAEFMAKGQIAAFSSMTQSAPVVYRIIAKIRRINPDVYIIWGGIHAIIQPEDAIKYADAVCTGEGEFAFKTFLELFKNKSNYTTTIGHIIINTDRINVLIDDTSLNFIKGSKIDYVTELIGSSFKITNPQASSSCGCGTSFSI